MNKRRIQKAIALVLALALMLSAFTVNMFVSAEAEPEVWNGQISDTAPVDSDSDGWIEINNGAELAYVIKNGGGEGNQYKLTADIYLNAKDAANWQTGAPKFLDKTPNSWYTNTGNDAASEFAGGTIDGDGHVIYGMYFEGYPESYASKLDGAALIPRLAVGATVTIKNLGIDNAYINHTNSASAFIGVARTGTNIIFENCYVGENVTLTAYNAAAFRANAEYNRNATPDVVSSTILTNCYSLATIAEQGGSYGLVGTISDAKGQLSFTNCYNAKGALGYGGNIGYYAVATNCYATAKSQNKSGLHQLNSGVTDTLTANDMQGEAFAAQLGDAYVATESYPILKAFLPKCNHTYDNDCDADCNLCGEEREVGHNFVDNICTVCGAKNVWDGEISTAAPVDSDSDGWIEINNGAELAYIIKNGGGAGNKYIITNDIYLNNITTDFWTNGAPEGVTLNPWFDNTSATDFNGEIDGNGKIVYGLYYANDSNRATKHYFASGLIPRIAQDSQVTIKNLGINNAYIKHPNAAAAFLGSMVTASSGAVPSVNIENCYAGANVTLNSNYAGVFVANTGNQPASITVKNSYSLATMDAATKGLLAYIGSNKPQKAELVNCYNGNGPIRDIANPGYTVSTTNCYETVESPKSGATAYWLSAVLVSAENMTGPNALTVMPLGDAYAATNSYPVLKVFLAKCNHTYDNDCDEDCNLCGEEREAGHNFVDNICTVCGAKDVWNGQVSDTAPVDSDSDGWIEINNGAELAYIIKNGGGAGNKYILTTDIYLNDITTDFWTNGAPEGVKLNSWFEASQAGDFNGTINGDGHVVYGLYYNASLATGTADGTGLIPRVNAGSVVTIENLGIDNAYIKHTKNASAFVGVAYKSGRLVIDKCYVGQNVTIEAAYAGAFRGYANNSNGGSITNSYSLAKTIGTSGRGLVAIFWEANGNTLDISNCYNANGPISSHNHVGNTVSENNYVTEETGLTEGRNYVSAENMTGPNALTVMPLGDAYAATNGYPVLKVFLAKCNHTYDNDCDEDCNLCGEEREAGHNFVDNICTVCGAKDVWNGQISDTAPVDSDSDGWIEINNGAELAYIIKNGGGAENKYILTNDIYLNDITTDFWTNGAPEGVTLNPWFEASQAGNFKGTINGDGHVVYGLYYNASLATGTADGTGLIPRVNENEVVTITNLGVDNAYIKHTKNASAFVGVAYKSGRLVIDKCYVGQNVTIEAAYAGAFRGYANSSNGGSITNSYSLAKTIGTNRGLVATFWEVNGNTLDISNCYNANGPISTHNHVGNTVSENNYVTEETGLTEGRNYVSAENMTGPNALTVMPLGDAYAATNGYPVLKVFYPDYAEPEPDDEIKIDYWNGNMTQPKTDEQGNYLITNGAELAFIIKNGGGAGNVYKLTNDIYLNNLSKVNWKNGQILDNEYSINKWFEAADATDFRGTIDGDGHVIYGLYFADAKAAGGADGAGLIPRINAGSVVTIKNLGIDNAYINHTVSAAAFVGVGYQSGELTMDSCYAGANVTVKAQYAGAFRGYSLKTANELITNSYSLAATDGTQMGLFAYIYHASGNMLTISNCYNANGPISTHAANGEVVATNCYESYYRTQQSTILYVDGITGVATADMVGVGVLSQDGKLSGLNANNKFIAMADTYPMLKVFFKLELQKNGKTYIGNKYNSMSDYYVVASDFSDYFWRYEHVDANTDNAFNIADLVYMKLKLDSGEYAADLDYDLTTTIYDLTLLRRVLTGDKEFAVKPYNKEYQISNSKISTGYSLVWKDEFDGTSIDTNKWNPEGGQMGGANSDVTITPTYNDRTTSVADGKLKLTAYKASGNEYIIPKAIASNGTMNYKYGYVEIRAKIPTESGAFSSFWTRSVSDTTSTLINGKLDHYAEVDMFEVFSHTSTGGNNALAATILKNFPEDRSKDWYSADMTNGQQPTNYIDDEYHIFGYEWTPYEMKMYIDGELYARFDITVSWNQGPVAGKGKDGWSVTWYTEAKHPKVFDKSGTGMESFHEAQYLIFNNYLHHANSAGISVANNSSFTQAEYIIDYCRVYQLDGQEIYTK